MLNIVKIKIEFLNHCQYEKRLSPKTLKAYEIDIRQFVVFLQEQNHSLNAGIVDKHIIRTYLQSISLAKPKTVKRKMATIKALFNYLEYEDRITANPFRKIRLQIREPKVLPNVMNLSEIEQILGFSYRAKCIRGNAGNFSNEVTRDIAVMELLFATGIRVSELSNLRFESINLDSGQIKIKGKGNKERIVQVCNGEAMSALKEYLALYAHAIQASGYFFVNRFGRRLSEQSVRFMVKKHAASSGLQRRITPHAFRHSFATLLLEEDVDIKYIQHLLGHSSIMTTQIYTHVNSEKQRQILERHPRGHFRMLQ